MRPFTRTLAIGAEETIDIAGRWITVLEATGVFDIQIHDQDGVFDHGEFQKGIGWGYDGRHNRFGQIHLVNTSGAQNTIKLVVSNGRYTDNRSSANVSQVTSPWEVKDVAHGSHVDGGQAVALAGSDLFVASALNRKIGIQPQGGDIWIARGTKAVNAATADHNSLKITDGQLYECESSEAFNAIAVGAAVNTYWITERI